MNILRLPQVLRNADSPVGRPMFNDEEQAKGTVLETDLDSVSRGCNFGANSPKNREI